MDEFTVRDCAVAADCAVTLVAQVITNKQTNTLQKRKRERERRARIMWQQPQQLAIVRKRYSLT